MLNPANPISPLSPMNPANPCSPLNPMNQEEEVAAPPTYEDKFERFQGDLNKVAEAGQTLPAQWMTGKATANVDVGVGSLKATADGFSLHVARKDFFGPTRDVSYLFHREQQTVEVEERTLKGSVRRFLLGDQGDQTYKLNLDAKTLT